jgi:hypothetical protein
MLSPARAATLRTAQRICHELAGVAVADTEALDLWGDVTYPAAHGHVFGRIAGQAEAAASAIFNLLDSIDTHLDQRGDVKGRL